MGTGLLQFTVLPCEHHFKHCLVYFWFPTPLENMFQKATVPKSIENMSFLEGSFHLAQSAGHVLCCSIKALDLHQVNAPGKKIK